MDDPTTAGMDEFIVIVFPGAATLADTWERTASALRRTTTGLQMAHPDKSKLVVLVRGEFGAINAALHAALGDDERHLLLQLGAQREASGLGTSLAWLQSAQRPSSRR
jgi:hypothetical protein